jgi:hypothetical protein
MNDGEEKEGMGEDKDWSYIVEKRKVREKGREGREKLRRKRKAGRWRARQGEGGLHMTLFNIFPLKAWAKRERLLWRVVMSTLQKRQGKQQCWNLLFSLFVYCLINLNKGQVTHLFMQTLWNSSGKRKTMDYTLRKDSVL